MRRVSRCSDYVRLFLDLDRPELNAELRPTLELCGNLSAVYGSRRRLDQQPVYSSKRSLVLEFHSGHVQRNHSGFVGRYRFIDKGWRHAHTVARRELKNVEGRGGSMLGPGGTGPPNLAHPPIFRVITVHKLYISCLILDNWTH